MTSDSPLHLFGRYPRLPGRLPRIPLTARPTPVEPIEGLGDPLWIKRDDRSGPIYGGNKPRKLEFILGAAVARGARTIVTFGGIGSHHALAVALCGRGAGLGVRLVAVEEPRTPHVIEMLRRNIEAGVRVEVARSPRAAAIAGAWRLLRSGWPGRRVLLVMPGGSTPTGCVGFVEAALELEDQVRAGALPEPAWIAVPVGSMGTAAGLLAGLALTGLRTRVLGVVVNDLLRITPGRILALADRTLDFLRARDPDVPGVRTDASRLDLREEWLGAGYGHPTPDAERALALFKSATGITLETTYTAKTLAAVLALRTAGDLAGPVLFWNTFNSLPLEPLDDLPDPAALPRALRRFFAPV